MIKKEFKEKFLLIGIAVIAVALNLYDNQPLSNSEYKVRSVFETDNLILVQSPYHLMKLSVCKWGIMLGREEF